MKKVKGLFLAALAAAAMFTSCGGDEDALAPEITFPNGGDKTETLKVGDTISFQVDVKAGDAKVEETGINVSMTLDSVPSVLTGVVKTESTDGYKVMVSYKFIKAGKYVFTVDAMDKDDLSATPKTKTVIVEGAEEVFTITKTDGVVWNAAGEGKGAWDLDKDVAISSTGTTDASIQNLDKAGVAFTGKFESENGTMFVKANLDFATVTKTAAIAAYTAGTSSKSVSPVKGDVYVAAKGTTYYVISITDVDAAAENGVNDGKVTFSYKK